MSFSLHLDGSGQCKFGKKLAFEQLENKRLLAVVWANEFNTGNGFDVFGAQEGVARAIVNRSIKDWNLVVADQNFDNDNNPATTPDYALTVFADDLVSLFGPTFAGTRGVTGITEFTHGGVGQGGWDVGTPTSATIFLDDNGAGDGWFFDTTPEDDIEFTSIANTFQASFVDATPEGQAAYNDFYRTILHEIGHALGITSNSNAAIASMLSPVTNSLGQQYFLGGEPMTMFDSTLSNPQFNSQVFFVGSHFYEGVSGAPSTVYVQGIPTSLGSHPNDLMNPGRTVPAGQPNPTPPIETTRQFISDLDVQLLADAYGYTVTLPSELNTAHAMLDSLTGTLLVQGSARHFTTGAGVNDTITLQRVSDSNGDDILVNVNGNLERIPFAQVRDIIIHGNGGTDTITVNPNVTQPWQQVQYVVSSNQDAVEDGTSVGGSGGTPVTTNGIVDLSAVVPGSQTTLRAAIIEANAAGAARSIYVGRGQYNLTLAGTGGTTEGDLDITGNVTIVGAGAGATVIDAATLTTPDRIFDVAGNSASLDLSRVTVTGGTATFGGAIDVGNNTTPGVTELRLTDVAIVGNTATGTGAGLGGGLFFALGTEGILMRSVITDNTASNTAHGGGGIFADAATGGTFATVRLDHTIVANNTASVNPDLRADLAGTVQAEFYSLDGNMFSTTTGANFVGGLQASDHVSSSVDYIVTSVVDSFDANRTSDTVERSLREAIDLANTNDGTLEEIWLPGWSFVLTRDRETYSTVTDGTDIEVSFGDLDISDSLSIRGVSAALTRVQWKPGIIDAVFDLLGDYDGNGLAGEPADNGYVNGRDFLTWQRQYGLSGDPGEFSADGNDDGDVDSEDLAIWQDNNGNTLDLIALDEILA